MYQDWMENTPIFGEIKDVYAQIWNKDKEEDFKCTMIGCNVFLL